MKTLKRILKELYGKWHHHNQRRRAMTGATAVACRMALNGCRL